jgi:hypothetical protein
MRQSHWVSALLRQLTQHGLTAGAFFHVGGPAPVRGNNGSAAESSDATVAALWTRLMTHAATTGPLPLSALHHSVPAWCHFGGDLAHSGTGNHEGGNGNDDEDQADSEQFASFPFESVCESSSNGRSGNFGRRQSVLCLLPSYAARGHRSFAQNADGSITVLRRGENPFVADADGVGSAAAAAAAVRVGSDDGDDDADVDADVEQGGDKKSSDEPAWWRLACAMGPGHARYHLAELHKHVLLLLLDVVEHQVCLRACSVFPIYSLYFFDF